MRGQGVGPDTRVGLALGRGVEMMTGLLAILKAGGAYVPLDPGYASERLRAILDDSRPAIVLADAAGRTALDALAGAPPIADLHADASRWSALPSTPPRVEGLTPRHLAYVIYTSGSTGQPKGVMVEHASVVNLMACAGRGDLPHAPERAAREPERIDRVRFAGQADGCSCCRGGRWWWCRSRCASTGGVCSMRSGETGSTSSIARRRNWR
ncbi:AMP-binding protein [Burkholderia pseudomallei]|uniref:AMP-binding protein n=1 Tax=Burkholderia pseudomallei TaxID=28450 RepID=UPI003CCF9BE5